MSQTIQPELLSWVEEQAKAGYSPEQLLKSMLEHGWKQEIAEQAIAAIPQHLFTKPAENPQVAETDQQILLNNFSVNRTQPGA